MAFLVSIKHCNLLMETFTFIVCRIAMIYWKRILRAHVIKKKSKSPTSRTNIKFAKKECLIIPTVNYKKFVDCGQLHYFLNIAR